MKTLSIIVPCYNEGELIRETAYAILGHVSTISYIPEIIFVNDGSSDQTLKELKKLAMENNTFKYISFSRNFGKESAMLAGLKNCTGDCAIIMDADLQHPPEIIPKMIQKFEEGYDQVIARRNRKGDSKQGTFFAKTYYKLVNKLVDVKLVDGAGDFRLLSRQAIDSITSLNENNRFSKGLFSWIGYNQIYIEYENQPRMAGQTKWSFLKLLSYGMDGIFSFNNKPLRVCIYLGGSLVGLSILYLIYLFIQIIFHGIDAPGYFTTILLITCLGGTQLLSLGIIGEYIGRIYYEVKNRPNYIIQETNMDDSQE